MYKHMLSALTLGFVISAGTIAQTNNESNTNVYLRSPDIHNNQLVFTSQGDLWLSALDNQQAAKRLTTHASVETQARFSPSGQQIAFVANYNNLPAVHVLPTQGGVTKQITFEYGSIKLQGWIDENTLLFSTNTDTGMHRSWVLKEVNVNTLASKSLAVSDAVQGVLSEDQQTLFFVQHGLQASLDNANQYKGGAAGELWRFDRNAHKSQREAKILSEKHQGSVHTPMLHKKSKRLYFVSNENNIDNIWSMTLNGNDLKQHTQFKHWAVRGASLNKDTIVFQHGADLKRFDLKNQQISDIPVKLQSDFLGLRTKYINKPMEYFEDASIDTGGTKALVTARGHMAVATTTDQRLVKIDTDASARFRHGILSTDGKYVYAVSDQSGEYQVWRFDATGKAQSKQLTNLDSRKGLITNLWTSPDGKHLAFTVKSGDLWLHELTSNTSKPIGTDVLTSVYDVNFSLDSRYIAVTYRPRSQDRSRLYLHDIKNNESATVTSAKYSAYSPSFSHDMQWLYFLSERNFNANPSNPWGDRNTGSSFNKRTQVFAMALNTQAKFPFAPPTELSLENEDKNSEKNKSKEGQEHKNNEQNVNTTLIDFNNISQRQWEIDVPASNYRQLVANKSGLFLLDERELKSLSFEYKAELNSMTHDVNTIEMAPNKEHLLVVKGNRDSISLLLLPAELSYPSDEHKFTAKLHNWSLAIDPKLEYQQLFKDAWLMHRDSLFDRNMRGLDWQATKQKYTPLLTKVSERSELNDIFKQMMGELNTLHSQVRGGNLPNDPDAPNYASLGASYQDSNKGVVIDTIFKYDPEMLNQAPPIAHPSVNAKQGDIILAVNNQNVSNTAELKQALINTSQQQVLLTLQRGKKQLKTIVVPSSADRISQYRYQHWAETNLHKVNKADSNIGYMHLYAMGPYDLASFVRDFYAQNHKQGLIIDVRRNRGGNIDSILIEKLMRRAWSFWQTPDGDKTSNMQGAFRGHLVVLADQFTYSDGETFTAGIKALNLGTVIGKQTAGAGVWLTDNNRLTDKWMARVAEFPVFDLNGNWITEGRGISPDIEVTNLPHATFMGDDAQLAKAIKYLQNKISTQPIKTLEALPFPRVEHSANDINPIN